MDEIAANRQFAVVTDSTADITPEIARERGISVIPLSVTFGQETLLDGEFTQAEFFARMTKAPKLPTTSQPSVGAFHAVYERVLQTSPEAISVHISEKLSGTVESARQAAQEFGGRVHVFDSRNLSWGLGWQVLDAVDAADQGLSPREALERLERVREKVRLVVGLDSLDNLAKGGRIGRVSAFLGSMLNLKVLLFVDAGGEFTPLARTRGEKAALSRTLSWIQEQTGTAHRGKFAVGHALSEPRARWLAEAIKSQWDATELIIYETGSAIATHTGTGWGVAFLPEG